MEQIAKKYNVFWNEYTSQEMEDLCLYTAYLNSPLLMDEILDLFDPIQFAELVNIQMDDMIDPPNWEKFEYFCDRAEIETVWELHEICTRFLPQTLPEQYAHLQLEPPEPPEPPRELKLGTTYRNFNGNFYRAISLACRLGTLEEYVVFRSNKTRNEFVLPLSEFLEEVNKDLFPSATQKYYFEEVPSC